MAAVGHKVLWHYFRQKFEFAFKNSLIVCNDFVGVISEINQLDYCAQLIFKAFSKPAEAQKYMR
jgi:hypothetical protein